MMRLSNRYTRVLALVAASVALVPPASAGSWGSPRFEMSQSDDRFRTDGTTIYSSKGNRISKRSIAGGTHVDKQGVFLNPAVTKNRNTGEIMLLYFDLFNVTERDEDGTPNGLGRPTRVSFLTGEGEPIALEVMHGEQTFGGTECNRLFATCSTSLIEGGIVPISMEQYRRLIAATALSIRVEGSERSHVYEVKDVAPTFRANLATFYTTYLAPAQ